MEIIKFAKDFKKLDNDNFSTIRVHDRYNEGEIYLVKTPTKTFKARLMAKDYSKLKDIPNRFLMEDTDTTTYYKAMAQLKEFYPDINPSTEVVNLFFTKKIHQRRC
jgi:hypothetical protein